MNPTFNLIDDPWLPCLFAGEAGTREVSLREALARAPDISRLADSSPLVTAALHRLCLAMLHRVFGPASEDDWAELWGAGQFDGARLGAYFDQWRHAFYLFEAERPFYQTPGLPESAATTIARLGYEFSSGNNALLFDHSQDAEPAAIPPAAAARLLVAHQSFAIGGLISRLPGEPPSAEASHLVKAAVLVTTGANLFETLMLNLVKVNGRTADPFDFDPGADAPAWEREPPRAAIRAPDGYLDLLTWQPRRVLLLPEPDGRVARVIVMDGFRFPAGLAIHQRETMVAYVQREKPAAGQPPWAPIGFRPERALWRDSVALLQREADARQPALTLRFIGALRQVGCLPDDAVFGLAAFGLATDRAKVFLWRHEQFPLPLAYLGDDQLLELLGSALDAAERAGTLIRTSAWVLASDVLAPDGAADRARVSALTDSFAPERTYWPALDVPFRQLIRDLPGDYAGDTTATAAMSAWAIAVRAAASEAFERVARAVETSGRGYHAAAVARARFNGQLAGILAPLTPQGVSS